MYIIKAMGPMPLPCTTPLSKCAADDKERTKINDLDVRYI